MSRKLKPHVVDSVRSQMIDVDILLDRNKLVFFAELNGDKIEAKSAEECTKLARELIARSHVLEWEAVIEIEASHEQEHWKGSRVHQGRIDLNFERYERTTTPNGNQLKRDHPLDNNALDREAKSNSVFDDNLVVPYTDTAWTALLGLRERILDAGKMLDSIFATPKSFANVLAAKKPMLLLKGEKKGKAKR